MSGGFLMNAVVFLTAAVVCVPIAKRLGMGSVLGYLIAGILIGPFVLGFVGAEGEDIMHFAEFGVVIMLFLIGLELEPLKFWRMRRMVLGMGSLQVFGTAIIAGIIAYVFDFTWQAALATGLALAMSSTAIVLQSLKEKGLMPTVAGQSSFSVLLFQDVAVIPILAILPLLATAVPDSSESTGHHSLMEDLPGWLQTIAVLASVGIIILAGRYLIVPGLRMIARFRLRELFVAAALLIVFAIAYIMELVGLSPALGTFLGGVVLANSEFKHELESDLDPFKGLLLGLFFIAVGASINFLLIAENPGQVFMLVSGVILLKALVLAVIGKIFKLGTDQNILFAVGLSQVGEFAFVLFSYMSQLRILDPRWTGIMMAVVAMTMTVTPILLLLIEKFILSRMSTKETEERAMDTIEETHRVILVGFAHFGSTIGRFLRAHGVNATILDHDSDRVDLLRKMGFKVYYGDATRYDLLESAGAREATVLVSAIDDPDTNLQVIETVQKHFPHLTMFVRARNRYDAYELMDAGIKHVYRESLDTSVRLGVDVLRHLGFRAYSATRAAQNFIKYDEAAMWKLASERHDQATYIVRVREEIATQEQLLTDDLNFDPKKTDHAWDSEQMREALGKG